MKKHLIYFCCLWIGLLFSYSSCQPVDDYPYEEYEDESNLFQDTVDYTRPITTEEINILSATLNLPFVFDEFEYSFTTANHAGNNEINVNNKLAVIGRVLFYDKELSMDRSVSCASCHHQDLAFSDNVSFSEGVFENHTDRNSIAIGAFPSIRPYYTSNPSINGTLLTSSNSNNRLFWDNRARNLNEQMTQTFQNPDEMGISMDSIIARVKAKDYYKILFETAYQSSINAATETKILSSLRTFMSSFHASKTKFDLALDGLGTTDWKKVDFDDFTVGENLGKELFGEHCSSCHGFSITPNSDSGLRTANNGLDLEYLDKGVGEITYMESDYGKFKIPPLRNIMVTAPYMHDGRFATIEEVVDFYSTGIQPHSNLDKNLKSPDGNPKHLNFTNEEKNALVEFLNTLTDESFLSDEKYSDPFKN